ncbi:MAG: AraC family transcriptional regulator [Bacteroidales bacterium]|nr:AraC family transcriptional regulator [Bacteroidales bacterium]
MRIKRNAEAELARKVIGMVGSRLEEWVAEGKHKICYPSIDEILKDLDLTGEELSFFCSTRFGKPFLTWRKELRIEEAMDLLVRFPEIPAYKIGKSLGIKDKSNFRHQFKSVTGMTPSEFREKKLKKYLVK